MIRVLGAPANVALLMTLRDAAPGWMGQAALVRELGWRSNTVSAALRSLESSGVVEASLPRDDRERRPVQWRLREEELDRILDDLVEHLGSGDRRE